MLKKSTSALLFLINENCNIGEYKIFKEEDFNSIILDDGDSIINGLLELSNWGYIDIKYACNGLYCISLLEQGKIYREQEIEEKKDSRNKFKYLVCSSMLGGFCGAILGSLVFSVIYFFMR